MTIAITGNGTFKLGNDVSNELALALSGTLGGASYEIGYLTDITNIARFQPYSDGKFTANFQQILTKGRGVHAATKVVGGTGISATLMVHPNS